MAKLILPELGEDVKSAVVSYWHCDVGESVKEGADMVEMATDKATFNVPAPATGKLTEKLFNEGDTVKVGETLATIEEA